MSKAESEKLMQMVLSFIQGLTNQQYSDLLNGNRKIHLEEFVQQEKKNDEFEQIKEQLLKEKEVETILCSQTKRYLTSFCNYYGIRILAKDPKAVLYEKIAAHFNIDNREETNSGLNKIADQLQKNNSVTEAQEYLNNEASLRTKTSLMKLARLLDVYVNQKQTKEEILNRIVESVVGAKVRSKAIRMR
jgi:uracil DNA glycosylase